VKTVCKTGTDFQNPNRKEPDPKLGFLVMENRMEFCQRFLAKGKNPTQQHYSSKHWQEML
jgi:hypothetical protein